MNKITAPNLTVSDAIEACLPSILNMGNSPSSFHNKLKSAKTYFCSCAIAYKFDAARASLCNLPQYGNKNQLVVAQIKREDLEHLYTYYFVQRGGRTIYDKIKTSVRKCPFCCGINKISTLDHFLPKSKFPQYSIDPNNLIPSCKDCNLGEKGAEFSLSPGNQIIHPYFDRDIFFLESWISVNITVHSSDLVETSFFADPPAHWDSISIERAKNHFTMFKLGILFDIQSADELTTIVDQRKTINSSLSALEFREHLERIERVSSLAINNWRRVLFRGLALSDAFIAHSF